MGFGAPASAQHRSFTFVMWVKLPIPNIWEWMVLWSALRMMPKIISARKNAQKIRRFYRTEKLLNVWPFLEWRSSIRHGRDHLHILRDDRIIGLTCTNTLH